jgi:gag-polyprotein putative aspartyl protease
MSRFLRSLTLPHLGLGLLLAAGCALYTDVSIGPLYVLPSNLERGSDIKQMVERNDYLRAVSQASLIEEKPRQSALELASLGQAELVAGRFGAARRHLRASLELSPYRTTYADVAWNLSQLEFLENNFEASREWADLAVQRGLNVMEWHLEYLTALARNRPYAFSGLPSDRLSMHFGTPDVPRIDVRMNGEKVRAVIDSGAVACVISEAFARKINVRSLGEFRGTYYGLLNEPILVRFGMVERLELGKMIVENVPVSIMTDDKMSFVISGAPPQESEDDRPRVLPRSTFRIDVLLGSALLKEMRIELDYHHRQVTLARLSAEDRHPDADQNLFLDGFRPFVRGTVNKHGWFLFVLDTGSEITFLNEAHLSMLPLNITGPRMHGAMLQGLGGSKKRGTRLENIEIGIDKWAGSFKTMPTYATQQEKAVGIIGENMLKHFRVIIDFGRMRVDLIRERSLL